MKIIDLSHTISPGMPIYPGDEPPVITVCAGIDEDGFVERRITFGSHAGTHIDAPAHILPHSPTLDRIPLDSFMGAGAMVDLTAVKKTGIDVSCLKSYEPLFKNSEFILLYTGWSRFWGREEYFRDYPLLSIEAALWIDSFGLKGLGVDALSVDEAGSIDLPIHKILLERMLIIENLTNLEQLPKTGFIFSCFPLRLENADASPVRAVAIL
ncbi:MAG: cyclase family protein [Candidatus Aminicenantes bacterium]|nr:MAG: cyclase family protein [Candidatus Aminicenantes bacterium]